MKTMTKVSLLFSVSIFLLVSLIPPGNVAQASGEQTYIVLYKQEAVPANANSAIELAGGTLVYSYDEIGVAIARSDSLAFDLEMMKDKKVEGVSATADFAFPIYDDFTIEAADLLPLDEVETSASWGDPRSWQQWDMVQIHVPEAHAITTGSPTVVVAGIDTGINPFHRDLRPNVDWDLSVSCVGGVPDQDPAAWGDKHGHGTFIAGFIASAINGSGIVGVAPNVRFAAIKACGGEDATCLPEGVICSFMWAAEHEIDVTSNSYGVEPFENHCHNDPQQQAIWKAVGRAVRYAQQRGVTVVAAPPNTNQDLTHPLGGLTNACNDVLSELPGVIAVSANGNLMQKAFYSDYGVGAIDVVAPSGDPRFQITAAAPNGNVLSTTKNGAYGWGLGTSFATPKVAGVAALIISQYGKMPPGRVQAIINQTADFVPCPENPFNPGPPFDWPAECQGGRGYNSFYGHGQVNAFRAVTHNPQGGPYTKLVAFPMSTQGAEAGELLPVSFAVFNGGDSPELVDYQITDSSGWLATPIAGQIDLESSAGYEIAFEIQVPIEDGSSIVTLNASTAVSGAPQDQVTSETLLPEPSSIASLGAGALLLAMLTRRRSRHMSASNA
jgi:subtilisin family serine protease